MAKKTEPDSNEGLDKAMEDKAMERQLSVEERRKATGDLARRMSSAYGSHEAPLRGKEKIGNVRNQLFNESDPMKNTAAQAAELVDGLFDHYENIERMNLDPQYAREEFAKKEQEAAAKIDKLYENEIVKLKTTQAFEDAGGQDDYDIKKAEEERQRARSRESADLDWKSDQDLIERTNKYANGLVEPTYAQVETLLAELRRRGLTHEYDLLRGFADAEGYTRFGGRTKAGREAIKRLDDLKQRPPGHIWIPGVDYGGVADLGPRKK